MVTHAMKVASIALQAGALAIMLGTSAYGRDLSPPPRSMDWRVVNPEWTESVCTRFPSGCATARAAAQTCPGAGTLAVLAVRMPQHNPDLIPDSLDQATISYILALWEHGYSGPNVEKSIFDTANLGCLARTFAPQTLQVPRFPPVGLWDHP